MDKKKNISFILMIQADCCSCNTYTDGVADQVVFQCDRFDDF